MINNIINNTAADWLKPSYLGLINFVISPVKWSLNSMTEKANKINALTAC
jgi:hypothetical protein